MAWWSWGDAAASHVVVCVHGLTRQGRDFDRMAAAMVERSNGRIHVVCPDIAGRGHSDWLPQSALYQIPQYAADMLVLLGELQQRSPIGRLDWLGTSMGGLIGMVLGAVARDRVLGLCLNDVGPEIARDGLTRIFDYVGRNPTPKTHEALAAALPRNMPGFANVPADRWLAEARLHYTQTDTGLKITYDPALRDAFLAAFDGPPVDLWPLFNSSGIFLGEGFRSELARPGAALYGLNPTPGLDNPMEQVVTLRLPILQLREVAPGATVGYGAAWLATRPSRIATVAGGYADGIPRAWDAQGWGVLHGMQVPLAGRVSMDLCCFDVTEAPRARPGDMVEILDLGQDADDLGAASGTIGYEILTRLGRRFRREYVGA